MKIWRICGVDAPFIIREASGGEIHFRAVRVDIAALGDGARNSTLIHTLKECINSI